MKNKTVYGIFAVGYDPDGNETDEFQHEEFEKKVDAVIFVRENQKHYNTRLFYAPITLYYNKESS